MGIRALLLRIKKTDNYVSVCFVVWRSSDMIVHTRSDPIPANFIVNNSDLSLFQSTLSLTLEQWNFHGHEAIRYQRIYPIPKLPVLKTHSDGHVVT